MEQEAIRFSLRELGVPVVHWDGVESLDLPLAALHPPSPGRLGFPPMTRAIAIRAAAGLLGAGCVVWAAVPPVHTGLAGFALFLAICGVAAGALRLILAGVPVPEDTYLLSGPLRAWLWFLEMLRRVPWEEGALIAVVWLEVLHRSRPWHTAVLGAALIAYLLATHLAESDASPGVSGRRSGAGRRARACSRSARAPGCCPRRDRARARRCCGWWRRPR